jgi:hypothetical protein
MNMNLKTLCAVVAAIVPFLIQQANAIPLPPGMTVFALPEADPIGGTVIATLTDPFVGGIAPNTYSGEIVSQVISGAVNPLGGLTFTYQFNIDISSQDDIGRLTIEGFKNLLIDASFQPGTGVAPTTIDRGALNGGDVIGFTFVGPPIGAGLVGPGMISALLVIQTDATTYTIGQGNIIDGAVDNVNILVPGVPDGGATLLLLGAAFLGVEAFRRKAWLKA